MQPAEPSQTPDVERLQRIILESVFLSRPLPGCGAILRLPEPAFILRHSSVYLAAEGLESKTDALQLDGKPVAIVSMEDLELLLKEQQDVAFLRFNPSSVESETSDMTLEAALVSQHGTVRLSAIRVTFHRRSGSWVVPTEPVEMAF